MDAQLIQSQRLLTVKGTSKDSFLPDSHSNKTHTVHVRVII